MELELLRYIQSMASPVLDALFIGASMLAEPTLLVGLLAWVYWNVSREAGQFVSYALLTSMALNNGIKGIFRLPRPIGQPGIRTVYADTATGYSFPSGHTQTMATVSSSFCLRLRRRWCWYLAIPLMFAVAFSRMYLGVHYPKDVLVGLLLGVGVSWLCAWLYDQAYSRPALYAVTFGLTALFLPFAASHDLFMAVGLYGGFVAGCGFEQRYVRFAQRDGLPRKLLRFAVGLAVLGVIYALGKLLPDSLGFVGVRYFLVGFGGYGLCPLVFRRLGV